MKPTEKSPYDITHGFKCRFCDFQAAGTKFNCMKGMLQHTIENHVKEEEE